ncbi:MAG: carboxypeptidase regulatory-like domain-containing protein [candidate division WOR-3 bacterium]
MRLFLSILLTLTIVSATVFGYTGFGGGKGLFRTQDARTEEQGLNVALHFLTKSSMDTANRRYYGTLLAPTLHFTPLSIRYVGMEFFATSGGIFQTGTKSADTATGISLPTVKLLSGHDLKVGGKISLPYLPVLKLGGMASRTFLFRQDATLIDQSVVPLDTLTWAGLLTLRFQDIFPSLPNILVNYGKSDRWTNYRAGIELASEKAAFYAELTSQQPENSTGPFDTEHGILRLTPGVIFGNPHGFAFSLAYTFGLRNSAGNEVIAGLNIASPFFRKPAVVFGELSGRVINASTKQPVIARVEFPENPKLKPVTTDTAGLFIMKKLPLGVIKVKVSAEGYRTLETFVSVEAKGIGPAQFELYPLMTYGTIAGTVTDALTNKPISATITFPDPTIGSVTSDPSTGAFRKDNIPVGTYTITVSAEGYFSSAATVQIEENRIATQQFALNPVTVKVVVAGTVTDRGSNKPLSAKVTFRDAATNDLIAEVNTNPTTGVYMTEIPVGTYAVTASSEGFIDQTTALVVDKGKSAKQDFALVKIGTTITLKGVYFDFNKATLKLPESEEALQAAYRILKENPTIRVEIQGHTDNVGSDEYNQRLSEKRAQAVVNYLVQEMGVESSRLFAKGYGESRPKASNDTPEGRALNRRVEFVVIGEVRE